MLQFEKGYLCFWDINRPVIWGCEPNGDGDGVVKYQWGSADYIHISRKALQEWNELGKWQSLDGHWKPVSEFLDHHYMLCEEDESVIADTPQEALRQFLLKVQNKEISQPELDYYVRKDDRFYYLNNAIDNKERWDELVGDTKIIYAWAIGLYNNHQPEMTKIYLQ